MINTRLLLITVLLAAVSLLSFNTPTGWIKAGSDPDKYLMGNDNTTGYNSKTAATIKSNKKRINGFGTLMQNCLPGKFAGKRIRMSGYIKTQDVSSWCGLWLRVDQEKSTSPLAFDNMQDRSVSGTGDWKKYEIVLDVPPQATNIAYGALLCGIGQMWFDNLNFEVVDNSIPVTGSAKGYISNQEPVNLDFER